MKIIVLSISMITMKQNLSKCVLVLKSEKIDICRVEYYKLIGDQRFWRVYFKTLDINAIIREDVLFTHGDVCEEEIRFSLVAIPVQECRTYNIPPKYCQLVQLKRDILSNYEIA